MAKLPAFVDLTEIYNTRSTCGGWDMDTGEDLGIEVITHGPFSRGISIPVADIARLEDTEKSQSSLKASTHIIMKKDSRNKDVDVAETRAEIKQKIAALNP